MSFNKSSNETAILSCAHAITKLHSLAFCAVMLTLSACQTTQPNKATSSPEPKILASMRAHGKGVPNGRTDSQAPYLRITKMELGNDPEYGYSFEKPIRTGPIALRFHLLYLNSLRGPKGEVLEYERKGSCCAFEDDTLPPGGGLLDVYKVKVDGSGDVITLYVDMYRKGPPQLPVGFTARQ